MKIRLISLLTLIILVFSINLKAQDDELSRLGFEEMPIKEEKQPYFGIAAGITSSFLFINFDDLNKHIEEFQLDGRFKSPMFIIGGEVMSVPFILSNTRISFFWYGSATELKNESSNKYLEYYLSFAGFSFNYAIVPFKSFAILPGVSTGWGKLQLDAYQGNNAQWDSFVFKADSNNFMNRADMGFIFLQPHLHLEYAMTDFFVVRLSASYNLSFKGALWTDDWKLNRIAKLENVPEGIGKINGLNLQIGLFVGLFNY